MMYFCTARTRWRFNGKSQRLVWVWFLGRSRRERRGGESAEKRDDRTRGGCVGNWQLTPASQAGLTNVDGIQSRCPAAHPCSQGQVFLNRRYGLSEDNTLGRVMPSLRAGLRSERFSRSGGLGWGGSGRRCEIRHAEYCHSRKWRSLADVAVEGMLSKFSRDGTVASCCPTIRR